MAGAIRLISTFPGRSAHDPEILRLAAPARDYLAIRDAAWKLLPSWGTSRGAEGLVCASIVDEYQDCSGDSAPSSISSLILPTCAGRPYPGDLRFRGNALADWNQHVRAFSCRRGTGNALAMAQRGAEVLGQWCWRPAGCWRRGSRWICAVGHRRM